MLAGTTIKVSGTDAATPAKIEIVGNELTASELLFTKVGNAVEIEGTNLGFSLQVGGTEVLGLTAGNFFLNIDDDGVVGGTTGGSISFTPDPDVSFTAAAVSLAVNTKLTAQSVDLDSDPLTAPTILPGAPLGSPFVRIEATAADLTILGSVLSADRFSFERKAPESPSKATTSTWCSRLARPKSLLSLMPTWALSSLRLVSPVRSTTPPSPAHHWAMFRSISPLLHRCASTRRPRDLGHGRWG